MFFSLVFKESLFSLTLPLFFEAHARARSIFPLFLGGIDDDDTEVTRMAITRYFFV